jgi:uncharacterized protein
MPSIVLFNQQRTTPEKDSPRADRRIEGSPIRTTWNHYTNSSGEIFAGEWTSEVGSWRVEFGPTEEEFFHVLEGCVRLTSDDGVVADIGPGESLVIPAGFRGTFAVIKPVRKHYMIVERKS